MSKSVESLLARTFPEGATILYRSGLQKRIPDEYPINEIWERREYTPVGFDVEEDDVVIDIGAHIGAFTIYAARKARSGSVYSYEPSSDNFLILQRNVAINNLTSVCLFQMAVANNVSRKQLIIDETNDAGASFFKTGGTTELVDCTTLEGIFKSNLIEECGFLKIDCEGSEYEILFSTPMDIFRKINRIALEYHVRDKIPNCNPNALINFLRKRGYVIVKHTPKDGLGILCFKREL